MHVELNIKNANSTVNMGTLTATRFPKHGQGIIVCRPITRRSTHPARFVNNHVSHFMITVIQNTEFVWVVVDIHIHSFLARSQNFEKRLLAW